MVEQIRMAIIGFGSMGKNYAAMLGSGMIASIRLTGVCCRNEAGQALLARQYPQVAVYGSVEEMERRAAEFDAVLIVTPHASHVELGLKMARLGKHIFMDKPISISAGEAEPLVQLCREKDLALAMMFNNRMLPAFRKAKEMLETNALGALHRAVWVCNSWYRPPVYHAGAPWRSSWTGEGGGLLINQNQHYLDIWQWLFGMPERMYADMAFGRYNDFLVDDGADIQFIYENGFHGTMVSASGEAPGVNRLEIWGEKGRLTLENGTSLFFDENKQSTREFGRICTQGFSAPEHVLRQPELPESGNPYLAMFENFAAHLQTGAPLCADGMDGIRAIQLTNAAYVSGWEGCRVEVPVKEDRFRAGLERARMEEREK